MEKQLTDQIKKERMKLIYRAVLAAIMLSLVVLAGSSGLSLLFGNTGNTNFPGNSGNYGLQLSGYMETQYDNDNIARIVVAPNGTDTIHPSLVSAVIQPVTVDIWENQAYLIENGQAKFNFSSADIGEMHSEFLAALENTEEVDAPAPQLYPSAKKALMFTVEYLDNSTLTFTWLEYDDTRILMAEKSSTSGPQTYTITGDDPVPPPELPDETRYLSPLSAFNDFISLLQDLYAPHLS